MLVRGTYGRRLNCGSGGGWRAGVKEAVVDRRVNLGALASKPCRMRRKRRGSVFRIAQRPPRHGCKSIAGGLEGVNCEGKRAGDSTTVHGCHRHRHRVQCCEGVAVCGPASEGRGGEKGEGGGSVHQRTAYSIRAFARVSPSHGVLASVLALQRQTHGPAQPSPVRYLHRCLDTATTTRATMREASSSGRCCWGRCAQLRPCWPG